MPFAYYARLGKKEKAIYDRSEAIPSVRLPLASGLWPIVHVLQTALERDDKRAVQAASTLLAAGSLVTDQAGSGE